ncbi:MAG: Cys-rich peptide radical SAM maturase CcpM [Lachnospiraceae bacterium]|nr:Cys-rich peptide radical SAM maturase CcpM [Lachnospiraceae bacterium]
MQEKPFIHLFKTRKKYYIYDVNTSSIICVKKQVFEILNSRQDFNKIPELHKLYEKGFLHGNKKDIIIEHPITDDIKYYLKDSMQHIILQLTQNCNLRCKYCVYSGSYKNRVHTNKRMNFETAKKAIDFYYKHSRESNCIRIGIYGGEPLLEFELIRKIVDYSELLFEGKELRINMTTNATLLNQEMVIFLEKHNIDLMISLDGPQSIQDKSRVFADNSRGTFQVIMDKIEMIKQICPSYINKISFNAVIDTENDFSCSSNFFTYDFLKEATVTSTGVSDRDAKMELCLQENFYINYQYELFKSFLSLIGKLDKKYTSKLIASHKGLLINSVHTRVTTPYHREGKCHPNGPCIAGANRLFVTVDGEFYPCERVSESNTVYNIGNLQQGIKEDKVKNLLNTGKLTEKECKECWAINLCSMCAADIGEGTLLSSEKKRNKCKMARKEVESHLIEYCALREYGYFFDD